MTATNRTATITATGHHSITASNRFHCPTTTTIITATSHCNCNHHSHHHHATSIVTIAITTTTTSAFAADVPESGLEGIAQERLQESSGEGSRTAQSSSSSYCCRRRRCSAQAPVPRVQCARGDNVLGWNYAMDVRPLRWHRLLRLFFQGEEGRSPRSLVSLSSPCCVSCSFPPFFFPSLLFCLFCSFSFFFFLFSCSTLPFPHQLCSSFLASSLHAHTHTRARARACTCTHAHTDTDTQTHTYIHTHTHTQHTTHTTHNTHTHTHTTHTHTHTHTHTTHTRAHTHTHAYAQTSSPPTFVSTGPCVRWKQVRHVQR
jgi:hypothetical protein